MSNRTLKIIPIPKTFQCSSIWSTCLATFESVYLIITKKKKENVRRGWRRLVQQHVRQTEVYPILLIRFYNELAALHGFASIVRAFYLPIL